MHLLRRIAGAARRVQLASLLLASLLPLSACQDGSSGSGSRDGSPGSGFEDGAAGVVLIGSAALYESPWQDTSQLTLPNLDGAGLVRDASPWERLGLLSGRWSVDVERIESDCVAEPDLPGAGWFATQREDWMSFSWGEGIAFALVEPTASGAAIVAIDRIGVDGVARLEGTLVIETDGEGRRGFDGIVDYAFDPDDDRVSFSADPDAGAPCSGRVRLTGVQQTGRPEPGNRDLHFVLRWPAGSEADLDLILGIPVDGDPLDGSDRDFAAHHADFSRSTNRCYALASTGRLLAGGAAGADVEGGFMRSLSAAGAAGAAFHEEIIRCSVPSLGLYLVEVVNWEPVVFGERALVDSTPFELEAFLGPRAVSGGHHNTSFGVVSGDALPRSVTTHGFQLEATTQPPGVSDGAVQIIVGGSYEERPYGFLTDTWLEFHRAGYEGLSYEDFLDELP